LFSENKYDNDDPAKIVPVHLLPCSYVGAVRLKEISGLCTIIFPLQVNHLSVRSSCFCRIWDWQYRRLHQVIFMTVTVQPLLSLLHACHQEIRQTVIHIIGTRSPWRQN